MRPNGRNRNDNPNRSRDYEENEESNRRDFQNYGSEFDEPETGRSSGRYGSGNRGQQYPSSGYYSRYDEPRRSNQSSDENYRNYGRQGGDENYGGGSRSGWEGYGAGRGQDYRQGRQSQDESYGSSRGQSQQGVDNDYYYGRGNYAPQYGSGWRENPSYSSGGMGFGDAEEQGRYGSQGRFGSQGGQGSQGGYGSQSYGSQGQGGSQNSWNQGQWQRQQQQQQQRGPHSGKGPKGYQRSDERIKEDVNEALSRHWDVDASNIEVEVKDGEVTLTGSVDSREARRYAEEAVENCFGVKDVENRLKVKKESGSGSGWGSEMDTSRSSQSSQYSSTSKLGESGQGSTMGDVKKGAGTTAGSR